MRNEAIQPEKLPHFPIETVTGPEGSEMSFSPDRGGIITSLKLGGKELLYLDRATFDDPNVNVKGGIPVLFPNAGPLENSPLKQHGFARTLPFTREDGGEPGTFSEAIVADDATRAVFNYNFSLVMHGSLNADGSFTLTQEVANREIGKDMPLAMGLHPYFRVSADQKRNIRFDFLGGETVMQRIEDWANGTAVFIPNPGKPLRVTIPGLGTLVLEASREYQRIWVWSQPGKDFVCIEPVMRDQGGLIKDPALVKAGQTLAATLTIRLE